MDNLGEQFRAKLIQAPGRHAYEPAKLWKRAASLILDVLVLNILVFSAFGDMLTNWIETASIGSLIPTHIYVSIMFISFLSLMYFSLLQYYAGQTIGMMITRIYVIPKPGFWKAVIRNLYLLPIFPFNLLWIIEPVMLVFKKRRILETLTNTNTVEDHNA